MADTNDSDAAGQSAGFPEYPAIADLPAGMTEKERYEFAFKLIAEQGDQLGNYLFAATRVANDHDLQGRWFAMIDLVQSIHGGPINLTYNACDRIEAEGQEAQEH